jgi:peptide/nickel transport system permease protein
VTQVSAAAAPVAAARTRANQAKWRLLLRRPTFVIGALILLFWVVCAVFGASIAPHDPLAQQLLATNAPPSSAHWFGTDQLGRDVLSRVIIAFLFIVALGPSVPTLVLVIGIIFTPLIARTVRSAVLTERDLDYLPAARLLGERSLWIMFREILPNVAPTVLVEFTVRLGYAIFTVATLSFLGFGIQPPTPDWGADIYANYGVLPAGYWWETLFPALAVASLVTAINLVTDSIEQVLSD